MQNSQIILGIDPGTLVMGYGVICVNASKIELLEMDVLKLSAKKDNYERLSIIHHHVQAIISKYKPHQFAIEAPFFGKNVQSMLKLGRAQGVAIAVAMQSGIPVTEYSPRKVKQSITGNGNADKNQVWEMLQRITNITHSPAYFDASDALAVAICHHFQLSSPTNNETSTPAKRTKKTTWEQFVTDNPGRVAGK
ncbi:crossover junction endodeoxyribonuclease RuvC [Terrimonas sp.]|uniref:crossover junction endodeoxyribonuclease RuvC n=1 Tax=Terrimonas sp. TaxID=1914338 RepID=UPI00198227DC|nr:crossover junction endodeoxyribonuclease RuvC [Terrimonas sp.]